MTVHQRNSVLFRQLNSSLNHISYEKVSSFIVRSGNVFLIQNVLLTLHLYYQHFVLWICHCIWYSFRIFQTWE